MGSENRLGSPGIEERGARDLTREALAPAY